MSGQGLFGGGIEITKSQRTQALTAVIASVLAHQKKILAGDESGAPVPSESKHHYLHDPTLSALIDAAVCAVLEIIGMEVR